MSAFADVRAATCQVLADDGVTHNGTAFCVLDGLLLTCHHVVFGLRRILLSVHGQVGSIEASYRADLSDPGADIAVLGLKPGLLRPIQVGRAREGPGVEVYGYGYRPKTLSLEPQGHTFHGRLGPGQMLKIPVSANALRRVAEIAPDQRGDWNLFTDLLRAEHSCNLEGASGLEPGISGGPIYDPTLRRVTGLFRAVEEGDFRAYVIPLDAVAARWPAFFADNARAVPDAQLDELQRDFEIKLVAQGAAAQAAVLRSHSDGLFVAHTPFGGRERELGALDTFAASAGRPYYFITAHAGFGKTALLAHWTAALLRAADVTVVYHFLSRQVEKSTTAEYTFTNLCEQLMAAHGLGGGLPVPLKLSTLFARLLQLEPPPGTRILVVIDGLDEAFAPWEPTRSMFPESLPDGVKVVFSARDIAGRDLRAEFGLDEASVLRLGALDQMGIASLLAALPDCALDPAQAASLQRRLWELSQGDAFYLRDLLADLAPKGYDPALLEAYPIGHNAYLKRWWQELDTRDAAFKDLMGLLVVAREPLSAEMLASISGADEITAWNIEQVVRKAARYIVGSESTGLGLSHRRIQEFVETKFGKEIAVYRQRFADYCLGWATADLDTSARRYVLRFGVQHVADAGGYKAMIDLVDSRWIAGTWREWSTYATLIDDLNIVARRALVQTPPDTPNLLAAAVARATARAITAAFPAPILVAMARFGGVASVIALLRAERGINFSTRQPEALIAIAREILRAPDIAVGAGGGTSVEFALMLLQRAIDAGIRQGELEPVAPAGDCAAQANLEEGRKRAFFEQARLSVRAIPADAALLGAALATLARSAATVPAAAAVARSLIADARGLPHVSTADRLAIEVYAVAAEVTLDKLDPVGALQSLLATAKDPFAVARYLGSPLVTLLEALPWELAQDRAAAVAVLVSVVARARNDRRFSVQLAVCQMRLLGRLRAIDEIRAFRDLLRSVDVGLAAMTSLAAAPHIASTVPQALADWLEWAAPHLPLPQQVYGWASAGQWERVLALLPDQASSSSSSPKLPIEIDDRRTLVSPLLDLLPTTAPSRAADLPIIVRRLLQYVECDTAGLADHVASAACILGETYPKEAGEYYQRAVALRLTDFPAGDLDDVRRFATLALTIDGQTTDAVGNLRRIGSEATRLRTLRELVVMTPPVPDATLETYLLAALELSSSAGGGPSNSTLEAAFELLEPMRARSTPAFETLVGYIRAKGPGFLATATKIFLYYGKILHRVGANELLPFADVVRMVTRLTDVLPAQAQATLAHLEPICDAQAVKFVAHVRVMRELALTMDTDPSSIAKLAAAVDACLNADLAIPPYSADDWLAVQPRFLGPALVRLSVAARDVSACEKVLALIKRIRAPVVLAEALGSYWDLLGKCAAAPLRRRPTIFFAALDAFATVPPSSARVAALRRATNALFKLGQVEVALGFIATLANAGERVMAADGLSSAARYVGFGRLSPLESAYLSMDDFNPNSAPVVLADLRAGKPPQEPYAVLSRAAGEDLLLSDRRGVLYAGVWPLLLPLYLIAGSSQVASLADAIEHFDAQFREAATLLTA